MIPIQDKGEGKIYYCTGTTMKEDMNCPCFQMEGNKCVEKPIPQSSLKEETVFRLNIEELKKSANKPRLHGNAFIQLDLENGQRLHVWHPALKDIAQKVRTPIHDHLFDFSSKVILGNLKHKTFDLVSDENGTHTVYRAIPRHKEDTELIPDNKKVNLVTTGNYTIPAGSEYFFGACNLHEGDADELTATILTKLKRHEGYPRVLCENGYLPDNDFNRYQIPEETLWKYIEDVQNALVSQSSLTPKSIRDIPSHASITLKALEVFGDEDSALNIKQHEAFIKGAIWLSEIVAASLKPNKLTDEEIEKMAEKEYPLDSRNIFDRIADDEIMSSDFDAQQKDRRTSFIAGCKATLNNPTIGDSIDKFKWSELEKIATPEKWMKMYKSYSEMLTHEDVSSWWQEQFNIANAERNELKLSAEKYQIAIANLIEAIPSQTNDKDWWPDSLTDAVNEANKLL